ncbi:MAG TPA: serine hydrolase domain-containing protein [Micromonosporaceae bacterium]
MAAMEGLSGSVLVVRDSVPVVQVSTGMADGESGAACTLDTRFQIASVSKQFTAAAVMLLVEDQDLALDVPIAEWLPDCAPRWRCLTLHRLLSHTSGLGQWHELSGFDITEPGSAGEFLERFGEVPLRTAPGTAWHYSSPGYLLAAQIIEEASGRSYADFLTERVLRPLGLDSTSVGAPASREAACGYRGGLRVDAAEFAAMPGAGDVWSTVGDLARYTAAFHTNAVVTEGSRETMLAAHMPVAGGWGTVGPVAADGYGYGYCLGTLAGRRACFHPGDNPGYQSFLGWLPEVDTTIAILANDEETSIAGILSRILPAVAE